eukprot:TRINITY_DN11238_c0_g1_i2.p3 TRINITY_DN11238_c0_g1~~TRINITY_DN11238_c0_g1_i2.p3  ORF type:complete len:136 (-),score=57.56 TRINITY_DN11238_c0_g1_i2:283-690(-)
MDESENNKSDDVGTMQEEEDTQKVKEINEDLEEGECTSEEEEAAPAVPEPVQKVESESDEKKKDRKHRHRSRSRDRYKNKKRRKEKDKKNNVVKEEISEEEQKKRAVLKRLKALEADMGIYEEYYSEEARNSNRK